jgi:HK97 family phage portal protein
MGLFTLLLAADAPGPADDYWYTPRGEATVAGVAVSPDTAMGIAAVFSCVRVRAETVGMLPLHLYRREGRNKAIARDQEWYGILTRRPNPWQTASDFRQMMQSHVDLRGNAYAYKQYNRDGSPKALIPMHPDRMDVKQLPSGEVIYKYLEAGKANPTTYYADEVFHIKGLSAGGVVGMSVVGVLRETLGGAVATQQFANRLWSQGALMRGILTTEKKLGPEGRKRLRESFEDAAVGASNQHRTPVFEEGLTFQSLSLLPEDAQFLETRKFSRAEIAGAFRVPAHMINDLEKATFSNIEELGLEFVKYNMMPAFVMWEQAIGAQLIGEDEPDVYAKIEVNGLLRGDAKSRAEFYTSGITSGWLTRNEPREWEDLDPLDGLDAPLVPNSNAVPIDSAAAPAATEDAPRLTARHRGIIETAAALVVSKEVTAVRRAAARHAGDSEAWASWVAEFYAGHASDVAERLRLDPVTARAYCAGHAGALLSGGLAEAETWNEQAVGALARLAVGDD